MAKKAELKTQATEKSALSFIDGLGDAVKSADCREIYRLMQDATGKAPKMWGDSIVGFGERQLKYESGRELDWFVMGFAPRKAGLTLYFTAYQFDKVGDILSRLGKHKLGKGCLYINKLADVDGSVLKELIVRMSEIKP